MDVQLIPVLCLCYISLTLPGFTRTQDTCYPCGSLNKVTEDCTGTQSDCTQCIDGYQEILWTLFCAPSDTLICDHYENMTVPHGATMLLRCQFDLPVDCVWQRNGIFHLDISNRYSYVDSIKNGVLTTECSILIQQFNEEDHGQWECKSMADSETVAIEMTNLWLQPEARLITPPENATISPGNTVILNCQFDAAVQCNWMKNNDVVDVDNEARYTYASTEPNSCSIEIQEVEDGDAGEWKCGGQTFDKNIVSSSAWITTSTAEAPDEEEEEAAEASVDLALIITIATVGTLLIAAIIVAAIIISRKRKHTKTNVEIYEIEETPSMKPMLRQGSDYVRRDNSEMDKLWRQTPC